MLESTELFETAMSWLRNNYPNFHFFQERDIVWTIQTYITEVIKWDNLPYKIFNDYPILPGKLAVIVRICNQAGFGSVGILLPREPIGAGV